MSNVLKFLGGSVVALLLFGGWQLISEPKHPTQRTTATQTTTRSGGAWFPTATGTTTTTTTTTAPRTPTTTRTTTTSAAPTSYQESYRSTDWQQRTGYLRWYRGSFATKARCTEHRKLLFDTPTSGSAWPKNLSSQTTVKAGDCELYSNWFGGTGWYYSIYQ